MAFVPYRRMFRHVLIEGVSFFADQHHLRLHCRVNRDGRPVSASLHADYHVFNALLHQLSSTERTALSAWIAEALMAGGRRWNFIDVNRALGRPCTLRRCLVESVKPAEEKTTENPLKVKALRV